MPRQSPEISGFVGMQAADVGVEQTPPQKIEPVAHVVQAGGLVAPFVQGVMHTPPTSVWGAVQSVQSGGLFAPFEHAGGVQVG